MASYSAQRPVQKQEASGAQPTPALVGALSTSYDTGVISCRRCNCGLDAFVVERMLSPDECGTLRREAQAMGYSFWNPGTEDRTFRNVDTVEVTCQPVADALWERMKPFVTPVFQVDDGQAGWERGMAGTWVACGVNPVLLFCDYSPGGHFSPHTDGNTIIDFNHRSLYSMLVYLNTCEQGGETTLFVVPGGDGARCDAEGGGLLPDDARRLRWPPEWRADAAEVVEGSVLVFSQDLPHEGAPVGEGHRKVIIRTDVMYRREPPVCADPQGLEAYALWQQAQEVEAAGDPAAAIKMYRAIARKSPQFAEIMGLA